MREAGFTVGPPLDCAFLLVASTHLGSELQVRSPVTSRISSATGTTRHNNNQQQQPRPSSHRAHHDLPRDSVMSASPVVTHWNQRPSSVRPMPVMKPTPKPSGARFGEQHTRETSPHNKIARAKAGSIHFNLKDQATTRGRLLTPSATETSTPTHPTTTPPASCLTTTPIPMKKPPPHVPHSQAHGRSRQFGRPPLHVENGQHRLRPLD